MVFYLFWMIKLTLIILVEVDCVVEDELFHDATINYTAFYLYKLRVRFFLRLIYK